MKKPIFPFIVYLALFYLTWTVGWVHGLYPWATRTIGDATVTYAVINLSFRFVVWVLPVLGYLRYVDQVDDVLDYLQLKSRWKRGLIAGLTLSAINFVGTMARLGPPVWSSVHVTWNSLLGTSLLIGVFEEIPFRGFILRKLQERFTFAAATAIASVLFVAAHLPGWIMLGSLTAYNVIYIFAFGTIMAILLRYTRSLWAPIVFHSLNDGLSHVIFHI